MNGQRAWLWDVLTLETSKQYQGTTDRWNDLNETQKQDADQSQPDLEGCIDDFILEHCRKGKLKLESGSTAVVTWSGMVFRMSNKRGWWRASLGVKKCWILGVVAAAKLQDIVRLHCKWMDFIVNDASTKVACGRKKNQSYSSLPWVFGVLLLSLLYQCLPPRGGTAGGRTMWQADILSLFPRGFPVLLLLNTTSFFFFKHYFLFFFF